jgi:hypothetical protein
MPKSLWNLLKKQKPDQEIEIERILTEQPIFETVIGLASRNVPSGPTTAITSEFLMQRHMALHQATKRKKRQFLAFGLIGIYTSQTRHKSVAGLDSRKQNHSARWSGKSTKDILPPLGCAPTN